MTPVTETPTVTGVKALIYFSTDLYDWSSYETNIACLSAVTISGLAYDSPQADAVLMKACTVRRKGSTGDLLQTVAGASSVCVIRAIKVNSARGGRAKTRT
jgi:hypothetical protein